MKIRKVYAQKGLKTKSVKLRLIGGEKDYSALCTGYCAGDTKLSPLRKLRAHNTNAAIKNIGQTTYFDNIGSALVIATTGQIWRWTNVTEEFPFVYAGLVTNVIPSTFPCYYDGASAVAVVSGARITLVTADKNVNKTLPYQSKGACYHMGRMFVVDGRDNYTVRWSGTEFADWKQKPEGSGYITLPPDRGKIHRIFSFGDKLVVFREHGLDVIKAYGDTQYYSVVHQGGKNLTEKLSEDACAVCGGKLYFCSYDKIYCYDGQEISQVKLPDYMKATEYSLGKSFDGRYVCFYCKSDADGCYYQFELDTVNGTCGFFARDTKFIWKSDDGVFAWKDNVVYCEDKNGSDMQSCWRSVNLDLGTASVKTLKKIYLDKSKSAEVKITADGILRTVEDCGETGVGLSGRNFTFEVTGDGETADLEAEWEVRV